MSLLTYVVRTRRTRSLAGDRHAGTYARGRARRARRDFVRHHWQYLLAAVALFAVATVVPAYLVNNELARGVVIGLGLAGPAGFLGFWIVVWTGTGSSLMGELAEQWTASELRKLRRGGWRLVNHFSLSHGDMDHVLVGPAGIVVVETKWSAGDWNDRWHVDLVRRAAALVADSARQLANWHDIRLLGLPAPLSVVVVWDGAIDVVPPRPAGPAEVLRGSVLVERLRGLPVGVLRPDQVGSVWAALDAQVGRRDPVDAERVPVPDSVQQLAVRLVASVVVGLAVFVVATAVLTATRSIWLTLVVVVALVCAPWWFRRWSGWRTIITGWQAGLTAAGVLMLVTAGALSLR